MRLAVFGVVWCVVNGVATDYTSNVLQGMRLLNDCTNDDSCLQENTSDLLSTWFNLGLVGDAPEVQRQALSAIKARKGVLSKVIRDQVETNLACIRRKPADHNCAVSLIVMSLHAKRYNMNAIPGLDLVKSSLDLGPALRSTMGPINRATGKPDPADFDTTLVIAYAARLAGFVQGWDPIEMLSVVLASGFAVPGESGGTAGGEVVKAGPAYLPATHARHLSA